MDSPTDTVTAPVETPVVETPSDSASIADHAAQFNPLKEMDDAGEREPKPERDRRWSGRFASGGNGNGQQRAKSQRATPRDQEQIAAFTKRLRDAETDLGLKFEKQDGESDRAFSLRQRAEIAEALRDARKTKAEPAKVEPATPREAATQPTGKAFDKPRPKPEDFNGKENAFDAYTDALDEWRWEKRIHDSREAYAQQQQEQGRQQAIENSTKRKAEVDAKIATFAQSHGDYWEKLQAVEDIKMPDVLAEAIWTDDKMPEISYALAQNPDELVDLIDFAARMEYSQDSVALLRRRIARYARAIDAAPQGSKGASPLVPSPVIVASRPPTPLPPGPMKTREEPPNEPTSIADHRRWHGPQARR